MWFSDFINYKYYLLQYQHKTVWFRIIGRKRVILMIGLDSNDTRRRLACIHNTDFEVK